MSGPGVVKPWALELTLEVEELIQPTPRLAPATATTESLVILFQCEKQSDATRMEPPLTMVRGPTITDGRSFDRKRDANASPVRGSTIPRSNFQGGTSA